MAPSIERQSAGFQSISVMGSIRFLAGWRCDQLAAEIPEAEIPPEQYQDMDCGGLNAERTRLLAVRADLNTPLLSSNTDDQREAELTAFQGLEVSFR
jgi:hypothetical protein